MYFEPGNPLSDLKMEVIKYIEDGKIKIDVVRGELREILDEIENSVNKERETEKDTSKANTHTKKEDINKQQRKDLRRRR